MRFLTLNNLGNLNFKMSITPHAFEQSQDIANIQQTGFNSNEEESIVTVIDNGVSVNVLNSDEEESSEREVFHDDTTNRIKFKDTDELVTKDNIEVDYPKGVKYIGAVKDGLAHGQGISYVCDKNGKIMYKGGFENGLFHGEGMMYKENKKEGFVGYFKNGVPYGKGTTYDENGEKMYEFHYEDGVLKSVNGIQMYKNDEPCDRGTNQDIKKRKRGDNDNDKREKRPRYIGKVADEFQSQHFTNSSSSRNGGNEFDIKAIWKSNLFPRETNQKPRLTTTYKERALEVELDIISDEKACGLYEKDPDMNYKLTVTFKITENKLNAELVIVESEKEREEKQPVLPAVKEKPKRHCPKCKEGQYYANQMAITKPRRLKAGEIPCYESFKPWFKDLPSYVKSKKCKNRVFDNDKHRKNFSNNCLLQIEKRKGAEEKKRRN